MAYNEEVLDLCRLSSKVPQGGSMADVCELVVD